MLPVYDLELSSKEKNCATSWGNASTHVKHIGLKLKHITISQNSADIIHAVGISVTTAVFPMPVQLI